MKCLVKQNCETESELVVVCGYGWELKLVASGWEELLCGVGNVLKLDCGNSYTTPKLISKIH